MKHFSPTKYHLQCVATGEMFEDRGWSLDCPACHTPSLIRTQYAKRELTLHDDKGLYRYREWLPMRRQLRCNATHATYKSDGLAEFLGLENLYITFNGYFPESSFKINGIEWDSTKAESLFMNPGEVTISCEATRQTGTKSELTTKVTLKPATRHTVKFDLSTAGNASVVITFDDELEEVVELEFEMNDKA
jgi:cysteate synthase